MHDSDPIPALLNRVRTGDVSASEQLFEIVYGDLRSRAHAILSAGAPGTLQATALVHEAWLKLRGPAGEAKDRAHFLAIAAKAMRSVLTDYARSKNTLKRGGKRILLEEALDIYSSRVPDISELHDELVRLATLDQRLADIVELRFFGGLSVSEVADVLGSSTSTIEREWRSARAYLALRLSPETDGPEA